MLTNECTNVQTWKMLGGWDMHRKEMDHYEKETAALPKLYSSRGLCRKADLTEYDLSAMRPIRFEFQPKSERVNMRLPRQLLDAVRASAARAGVPYQRFIRQLLEDAVQRKRA